MTAADFLGRFPRVKQNGPGDWHVPCPAHDDNVERPDKFSLHVTATAERLLVNCFAGCLLPRILGELGLTESDLFLGRNGHAPMTTPRPTLTAFAARKRLDPACLVEAGWTDTPRGLAIPYRERDGTVSRVRSRTSLAPGQGFQWDGQTGKALIPYGRWRLDDALDQGELWVVEGESDTVTAWAHHLPCLGIPGNLAAKALDAEDLAGITTLWIVEEPGQSGRGFLEALRARLRALEYTGQAKVLHFAEKDLSDAHVAHGDALAGQIWIAQQGARDLWGEEPAVAPVVAPEPLAYLEPIEAFLAEEDPPTRWIFPDLLPADVLMLIHGEPRARKSLVGFELALSAATGTAPFGLTAFHPGPPIPVLYVQEEDPRSLTRPRLRRLVRERSALPVPTLTVSVRRGIDLDDPAWVARLTADIQRLEIRFLVLDAARRLSVKVDEGPTKVRELIAVLRGLVTETGVTIAIVHHDIKPPVTGQDVRRRSQRASGGDWFAACECPVHVERSTHLDSLVYPQDYKFGADPPPFTFTCVLDGPLIAALTGTITTTEGAESAGVTGRILAWLTVNGPASKTDLRKAGFGTWEPVSRALDALLKDARVDAGPGRKKGSLRYFVPGTISTPEIDQEEE